jgi:putative bacteriocin precursor
VEGMKKVLGKKTVLDAGTLVAYACGCPCVSPSCSCANPNNTYAETKYAMSVVNNVQNDTKLLAWG